jgi:hypothetical protein
MYKQVKTPNGTISENTIIRLSDNAFIPFDPDNQDFVEYQKWLSEGNTPIPADENA